MAKKAAEQTAVIGYNTSLKAKREMMDVVIDCTQINPTSSRFIAKGLDKHVFEKGYKGKNAKGDPVVKEKGTEMKMVCIMGKANAIEAIQNGWATIGEGWSDEDVLLAEA